MAHFLALRVCARVAHRLRRVVSSGVCVRVDRGHFLASVRACVCVLTEECRAGSAPPVDDDVMADSFLP